MTPQNKLETTGDLRSHPFAELVAEISSAKLSGSLRAARGDAKCVVYFRDGTVAFAVSNARSSRLFDMMIRRNRLEKSDVTKIPNFASDFEFAAFLVNNGFLSTNERDQLFIDQIEAILVDLISWTEGEWSFSSLARLRDGLVFDINTPRLLSEYARCLPVDIVLGRFRSLDERFTRAERSDGGTELTPNEMQVLADFRENDFSVRELIAKSVLPEGDTVKTLYTLWLGGLLDRQLWLSAFDSGTAAAMRSARLELKQEAKMHAVTSKPAVLDHGDTLSPEPVPEPEAAISVEEYLIRVERADTYYDVIGVEPTAEAADIRRSYFSLAKVFHPDHFHHADTELLRRVQQAFTELAQAYETLRNADTREHYDFKVRKELADREKAKAAGTYDEISEKLRQASENFERGFSLIMDNDPETAIPFLARAVHYDPKNARYHAYYGRALSADGKQRHKAESEMQAALRIDPNNPNYRIMLAEFFIQMNLMKRAEGELNRLLAIFPSNKEAKQLLESLKA